MSEWSPGGTSLAAAVMNGLAGRFVQHRRTLKLSTIAGDDVLLAESLRGTEALGEDFRLQVAALSLDAGIALKSLMGQPALVELLTAGAGGAARAFHGYITAAELAGANGGFARYHLTIEPWTRFLGLGRDSRVFQDMTVFDILDAVFAAYDNKGRLAPAWRYDIQDRSRYPRRSITTQYQESDLAFARRLMLEEGLFTFFEHRGDPDSPGFGGHTLVVADHNGAFAPNAQAEVRFTQPGAVMREDSIDRWRSEMRLQSNAIELASWDYRTRSMRKASSSASEAVALAVHDVPGVYAYANREHGTRIAENQLQALQARKEVYIGAGTVRTLAPGTRFTLLEHGSVEGADDADFVLVRTLHMAHNNLDADTEGALLRLLGECVLRRDNDRDLASSLHALGRGPGQRPVYRNRIDAIPSRVHFRSSRTDGQGRVLHPSPTVMGQQTAIVVGPHGAVIHTDRDHRIKVQFHWQRGGASHSRLTHPTPDGHVGAPGDDLAGTWVRVATPLAPVAGVNWGSNALPRVGQEVLVDFLDGNIDRPVVIGTVYNGVGQNDAQHNQIVGGGGTSTGNAPAWFPGQDGAHAHPAALSGVKSQALRNSQDGGGAYSQLIFDDSAGEARVALQRHAKSHEGTDELNLGHLRHQTDNERLAASGFGAELKSAHAIAMRAAAGMLLTTDLASVSGAQLESTPAATQIKDAGQLLVDLASTAQKHKAVLDGEPKPEELPAARDLQRSLHVVEGEDVDTETPGGGASDGAGGYTLSHLQLSSPKGIAALTPASAIIGAGLSSSIVAGQDVDFLAQASCFHSVQQGIGLFTYGKAGSASKPNTETGIRAHAASGKVSTQSQAGATRLTADKTVTVASVSTGVRVAAKSHILFAAQGAYIKLSGGDIEVHGPGKMSFKASMKDLTGPRSSTPTLPRFPAAALAAAAPWIGIERLYADGSPVKGAPYKVKLSDGSVQRGTLDDNGQARIDGVARGAARVEIGEDERDWTIDTPDEHTPNPAFGKELTIEQLIELAKLSIGNPQ